MSFLSIAFVWALPLIAAPIVIHLLHRRQQKVIRWGAMQFLVDSMRRRRRIWRLDDWLLMLLRTAALLTLILALARPLLRAAWLGAGPQRDVILVLDVSMSMGRIAGNETPFERLQAQLDETLARLSDQDSLQVVLAAAIPLWQNTEPVTKSSEQFATLRSRLHALEPSLGPGDLIAAIDQAVGVEPTSDAQSRLIAVITDGRAQGLPADPAIAIARLQQQIRTAAVPTVVNLIDVGSAADPQNIGLDRIESDRVMVGIGEPVNLKAIVTNYGTKRAEPSELRWTVGDEIINTSFTELLEPGQTKTIAIEHAFDEPGLRALTCRIQASDELPADNEARLILDVRERAPILVVASTDPVEPADDEARYVLAALGNGDEQEDDRPETFFAPTLIEADDVEHTHLSAYLGIVFTDVPPLNERAVQQLTEFVNAGGGLWLALGGDSDPEAFNRLLGVEDGLSPVVTGATIGDERQDQEFTALHPPVKSHPATGLLGDTSRLDIQDAQILRRWELAPRRPDLKLSVLLETSRGEPVAVEHFVGRGRVVVQSFPLTRAWSNLTLCKLFVPYVQEVLRYLVQPAIASHNLAINEPIVWRRDGSLEPVDVALVAPFQPAVALAPEPERDANVYRYFGTVFPGDYLLTSPGTDAAATVPFYVHRESAESDLRPWTAELRTALSATQELRLVTDTLDWPGNVDVKPAAVPAWSWLLWALAALVAVELLSISWFAWRKQSIRRIPGVATSG